MTRPITRRGALAVLAAASLLGPLLPARPAAAQAGAPADVVETLHGALASVMQNAAALGYAGRRAELAEVLPAVFAFPVMARIVVGNHWDGLTDAEKSELVAAYRDLSVATYANRFDGYSGERFVTGQTQEIRGGNQLVRTQLVRPSDTPVDLNYVVRPVGGEWRIVDVILEGNLSEVSRQRSEYASVLDRGGFAALMTELRAAIARQGG